MTKTTKSRRLAPDGQEFPWGPIVATHTIGDICIVEFEARKASNVSEEDWQPHHEFSLYIRHDAVGTLWETGWRSTSRSFRTLDDALLAGLCWKYETEVSGWNTAANSRAWNYIRRMIGMEN
jgi:hypothetical protein